MIKMSCDKKGIYIFLGFNSLLFLVSICIAIYSNINIKKGCINIKDYNCTYKVIGCDRYNYFCWFDIRLNDISYCTNRCINNMYSASICPLNGSQCDNNKYNFGINCKLYDCKNMNQMTLLVIFATISI